MSDNELGRLLRHHREAISPVDAGLPAGFRRRTPGLRRAELATLAGVSVEYLTRLEQGRDRHPSPQVLTALANALRLAPDDRALLARTAKAAGGAACAIAHRTAGREVRPTVRALLDQLAPAPAVLLGPSTDLLAYTGAYHRLAVAVGLIPETAEPAGTAAPAGTPAPAGSAALPNLLQYIFTDPRARVAFPDWDQIADEQVARLKAHSGFGDPTAIALAEQLAATGGAPFTQRYEAPARPASGNAVERWHHPELGELLLAYETLTLPASDDQQLVVYLAADDLTAAALEKLAHA